MRPVETRSRSVRMKEIAGETLRMQPHNRDIVQRAFDQRNMLIAPLHFRKR